MISRVALAMNFQVGQDRLREEPRKFVTAPTGASETPLPYGVFPTVLRDPGTSALGPLLTDAGDLAKEAARYVRALAVIEIDPLAEAEIDRLVAERVQGTRVKRPLTRKR